MENKQLETPERYSDTLLTKAWTVWKKVWRWLRWPAVATAVIYLGFLIWGIYLHGEKYATDDAIAFINSRKLTLEDAKGTNLPPPPDAANTTLEGVDVNANGIRDDVELAIFEKYPDDIKIRAAELQYAMALQLQLSKYVFNEDTLAATIRNRQRASFCISEQAPSFDLSTPQEEIEKILKISEGRTAEVENIVFNTEDRIQKKDENYKKYMSSYGSWEPPACDIEIVKL